MPKTHQVPSQLTAMAMAVSGCRRCSATQTRILSSSAAVAAAHERRDHEEDERGGDRRDQEQPALAAAGACPVSSRHR